MAHSEKAAWRKVLQYAQYIQDSLPANDRLQKEARGIMETAADMLDQVAEGIHTNPRRPVRGNPPLVVWANPGQVRRNPVPGTTLHAVECQSDALYEFRYRHLEDGVDYKHPFAPGVDLWCVTVAGQRCYLIFRPDGLPVWDDF